MGARMMKTNSIADGIAMCQWWSIDDEPGVWMTSCGLEWEIENDLVTSGLVPNCYTCGRPIRLDLEEKNDNDH